MDSRQRGHSGKYLKCSSQPLKSEILYSCGNINGTKSIYIGVAKKRKLKRHF